MPLRRQQPMPRVAMRHYRFFHIDFSFAVFDCHRFRFQLMMPPLFAAAFFRRFRHYIDAERLSTTLSSLLAYRFDFFRHCH